MVNEAEIDEFEFDDIGFKGWHRWDFIGLSTDVKPTPTTSKRVVDGSTYYESNTSKYYIWYTDRWYERKPTGGGGSGDTVDFDDLINRPSYNHETMTSETDIPEVPDEFTSEEWNYLW